jgi:hypothetical protein
MTIAAFCLTGAASANQPDLKAEILAMDKKLFDAFNTRDLETTKAIFDPTLEFFHDTGGLSHYDKAIANTQRLFANAGDLKRELVPESTEIYPIKDFGAIQTGRHKFCHTENQKLDCGTFKFLNIWKNTRGAWTLVRVVSYAH